MSKFRRSRSVAYEKRIALANDIASRYDINERRFRALVEGKRIHSVGAGAFKQALRGCIVVRLFHVY